jgi:hypothetical protein
LRGARGLRGAKAGRFPAVAHTAEVTSVAQCSGALEFNSLLTDLTDLTDLSDLTAATEVFAFRSQLGGGGSGSTSGPHLALPLEPAGSGADWSEGLGPQWRIAAMGFLC